jgi:hypothetical protein
MKDTYAPAEWLPLMDYSMKTGVSLSTLRRHIKAGKVEYRRQDGKYWLRLDGGPENVARPARTFNIGSSDASEAASRAASDLTATRQQLRKAQEEIAELKTLLACYEERER